ncbi:MAG: cytochrome c-type biogenesis protein CcmH [Solirubrobacterales bacterium]
MSRTGKVLLSIALALLLLPALAAAAPTAPQANLADIEDEVMCPICGTLLELAGSPQAQRQRVLIRRMIAQGHSKAEIKEALVTQYGDEVLALPRGSGFDLTAYLVPAFAFVLAVLALALGVRRWRRAGEPAGPGRGGPEAPQGEDAERLDADLARYDL